MFLGLTRLPFWTSPPKADGLNSRKTSDVRKRLNPIFMKKFSLLQ